MLMDQCHKAALAWAHLLRQPVHNLNAVLHRRSLGWLALLFQLNSVGVQGFDYLGGVDQCERSSGAPCSTAILRTARGQSARTARLAHTR